jgi:tetratricopeptide (TPR) repeat protein
MVLEEANTMSRFSRLEFKNHEQQQQQNIVKDEAHYLALAQTSFESGNFEQTLQSFAKVLEFNPGNVRAWTGQVRALVELGEFHEAKLWGEKAAEKFDSDPELLAARAVALARLQDLGAALAFSDASLDHPGESPDIWIARGDVLLARKEHRARYCFDKALSLVPGNWVMRWSVARAFAFYKKFAIALQYVKQALDLNSANPVIWLQAGQCELALGLNGAARHSFSQALQLDPGCSAEAAGLERCYGFGLINRLRQALYSLFLKS